ncbi:hypothetical protein [Halalkalibacter alkalisediminis]|uniref:Uncharacterized protein n=1 Tax=Halalkalibacter alkalisediminis TaxID=935616 RepID=A0ABV6NHT4_9BACI|nr:hypothetical protein [Halalkalibacter alkalisediminis]
MFHWNDIYMTSCNKQRMTELQSDVTKQKRRVFAKRKELNIKKERV